MLPVPSRCRYDFFFVPIYVFPPAFFIVDGAFGFAELFYSFQIIYTLKNIFFLRLLPARWLFYPYHLSPVCLHSLPGPFSPWPIRTEILFCKHDTHQRRFFVFLFISIHFQEQMLFMAYNFNRRDTDVFDLFF